MSNICHEIIVCLSYNCQSYIISNNCHVCNIFVVYLEHLDSDNLDKHIWSRYVCPSWHIWKDKLYIFLLIHFLYCWLLRPIQSSCLVPEVGNFYSNYFSFSLVPDRKNLFFWIFEKISAIQCILCILFLVFTFSLLSFVFHFSPLVLQ